MKTRRAFIALLCWVARPLNAAAQDPRKVPRIGVLDFFPSSSSADFLEPFRNGLAERGYIDGRNIQVEYRSAEQSSDRAAELAADYVRQEVDIIIALATPAAHAAKRATSTIPILMNVSDPIATGLVASLARPGANLTGTTTMGPELAAKRLELLRELRPGATRLAFLGATNDPNTPTFMQATQMAANAIGMTLQPVLVSASEEFEAAFSRMIELRADGVIVQPLFVGQRTTLAELALRHRIPLIADQPSFAREGGLAAYGINRSWPFRRLAHYVDAVLKGAKPSDLPIELPTQYDLVINLKTAERLGITIPPTSSLAQTR
ncbi:MAG: transporter substrate binding protein [Nitrobacter vulgaris]|nr:transporter substrate binding protein [Nitrobacter vulgaris]